MNPDVTLREITRDTVRVITELVVAPEQDQFVAPNAVSLAQALFEPKAWYRAVYLGDEPAGFVMLEDPSLTPPMPLDADLWIWRFMVDRRFQRRGVGSAALRQVIAHARGKGCFQRLLLSYVPRPGSAEPLYRAFGFHPTGQVEDGEVVMALPLHAGAG